MHFTEAHQETVGSVVALSAIEGHKEQKQLDFFLKPFSEHGAGGVDS